MRCGGSCVCCGGDGRCWLTGPGRIPSKTFFHASGSPSACPRPSPATRRPPHARPRRSGEARSLFDDEYFFLGGDEVDMDCFKNNPGIAAWLAERGWTADKLPGYFWGRVRSSERGGWVVESLAERIQRLHNCSASTKPRLKSERSLMCVWTSARSTHQHTVIVSQRLFVVSFHLFCLPLRSSQRFSLI